VVRSRCACSGGLRDAHDGSTTPIARSKANLSMLRQASTRLDALLSC